MFHLIDYLPFFRKERAALYIRKDFVEKLRELNKQSLSNLLRLVTTDQEKVDPREHAKLLRSFESGNSKRKQLSTYKKQSIPKELRWCVWERDNFTCQRCGSRRNLTVDHILPEIKGGELTMENLQTLCKSCNSKKGAR